MSKQAVRELSEIERTTGESLYVPEVSGLAASTLDIFAEPSANHRVARKDGPGEIDLRNWQDSCRQILQDHIGSFTVYKIFLHVENSSKNPQILGIRDLPPS